MKNFIYSTSRFFAKFMYVDSISYIADGIFIKNKIPVKFLDEWRPPSTIDGYKKFRVMTCRVRKKFIPAFEKSMEELKDKMPIFGYPDYSRFCYNLMKDIDTYKKNK